jgi:hypothetical protein
MKNALPEYPGRVFSSLLQRDLSSSIGLDFHLISPHHKEPLRKGK